ncbi:MAG: fructosamine kinase family protein [Mariniblastus sp.]|nr:fructosamine kinase family protein [Mariniblastus sp.]
MIDASLLASVQQTVEQHSGRPVRLANPRPVGGGCINQAIILETDAGESLFLKWNDQAPDQLFETEMAGLEAIRGTGALRVPRVMGQGVSTAGTAFLVLEAIQTAAPAGDFEQRLGRQLAQMHRSGRGEAFGFSQSNFLGRTGQPNAWNENWVEFWQVHRLGYQFELACQNGYGDARFSKSAERMLGRLAELLGHDVQPSLIHGDLWSGNYLSDLQGNPVLVDPAVYYGDREAEFGMTTLFGGLGHSFYQAYQEAWPLPAGSETRIEIYRLYHLLNHLNLFGTSYLAECCQIMQKYG